MNDAADALIALEHHCHIHGWATVADVARFGLDYSLVLVGRHQHLQEVQNSLEKVTSTDIVTLDMISGGALHGHQRPIAIDASVVLPLCQLANTEIAKLERRCHELEQEKLGLEQELKRVESGRHEPA